MMTLGGHHDALGFFQTFGNNKVENKRTSEV